MASDIMTLYPYMNGRNVPITDANVLLVPFNGTITFKWGVEQAGTNIPTWYIITANGRWGGQTADHYPIIGIVDSLPLAYNTYATYAAMVAAAPGLTAVTALASTASAITPTYGRVGADYYILIETSDGKVWVPIKTRTAAGTATIDGVLCNVFTAQLAVANVPTYRGEAMSADEVFELCWAANGRHADDWDAIFKLTPAGVELHEDIFDRTELNTRVAGEKAFYEDEFVTASQIEAGKNINLWYRDLTGAVPLSSYATVASRAANIIIEVQYTVKGALETSSIYFDSSTFNDNELVFQDRPEYHDIPEDSILPIKFELTQGTNVQAYAYNNNLYAIGVDSNPRPMLGLGDETVNFVEFQNSATVQFTVTGAYKQIPTPLGTVTRKGITINATGLSSYDWDIGADVGSNITINNGYIVEYNGINNVKTTVSINPFNPAEIILTIDRPLQIRHNGAAIGGANTTNINFVDQDVFNQCDPVPWQHARVVVTDREPIVAGNLNGTRDVEHYFPANHGIYSRHWYADYNPASNARTLGWTGAAVLDSLFVPIYKYETVPAISDSIVNDAAWIHEETFLTPNFNPAIQDNTQDVQVLWPGIYLVDISIEGIMGLNAPTAINPVVHPSIHAFITCSGAYNNPKNGIFDSIGSFQIRDFVPPGVLPAQYVQVYNSRPWSIRGQSIIQIGTGGGGGRIKPLLTYNPGTGENRFFFQVCTVSTRIQKLAGLVDFFAPDTTLVHGNYDAVGQQLPANFHTMDFNGI
jgi:hypothetical protein